jgi:excisionase family DNA binding protein
MVTTAPEPLSEQQSTSRWLLDIPETCRELHISRAAVFRLIARKELDSLRIGRRRLVTVSAIEAYIAKQQEMEASA